MERSASLDRSETADSLREASPRLRQDLVVALLTDRLLGGPWSEAVGAATLRAQAEALPAALDWDPDVLELVDLVDAATA